MSSKKQPVEKWEPVWVRCVQCGEGEKRHRVLYRDTKSVDEYEGGWSHSDFNDLIQCMGCETIKLHVYSIQLDAQTGYEEIETFAERVYPSDATLMKKRKSSIDGLRENEDGLIPDDVHKMYVETLNAVDAKCRTLAGAGLRAVVEAICLDRGITSGTLEAKINELADKRLLALPDAELLHEERYLGNAAVHEMATPSTQDLEDGLQIIEGLINTIYILQPKAKRMKEEREKKHEAKPHTKSPPKTQK